VTGRTIAASLMAIVAAVLLVLPVRAAIGPEEMLADPALEARAREIGRNLRCVVCQNQSIDDSDAELARDMRKLVRERLLAGDRDDQVYGFLTQRYGDFVLLRPPFASRTLLLWLGPAAALLIAGLALLLAARRRSRAVTQAVPAAELDADERRRLADLLDGERR
jgi:cytochrome c-type biogenesis protein CcmH